MLTGESLYLSVREVSCSNLLKTMSRLLSTETMAKRSVTLNDTKTSVSSFNGKVFQLIYHLLTVLECETIITNEWA